MNDQREEVDLPSENRYYRENMIDMFAAFREIWDGHLGRVKAVKHRIELKSDGARPIYSAPYQAGPAARKLEKGDIDKVVV